MIHCRRGERGDYAVDEAERDRERERDGSVKKREESLGLSTKALKSHLGMIYRCGSGIRVGLELSPIWIFLMADIAAIFWANISAINPLFRR